MHTNSRLMFENFAKPYFKAGHRVLEIGPDQFPSTYQLQIPEIPLVWETIDMSPNSKLTFIARDEYLFDLPSETYDIVLSGNVIEHVRKVWVWIKEVSRVCKIGGHVITLNPISWTYHPVPFDCWRIYPEGVKALYDEAGLEVVYSKFTSLESPGVKRDIPGVSAEWQTRKRRLWNKFLAPLGLPVERAYDTITIGKKIR